VRQRTASHRAPSPPSHSAPKNRIHLRPGGFARKSHERAKQRASK
jgi:hypothetical protein